MTTKLTVYKGDITKLKIDAIVNAANKSLLGGGGVDGAIHRAAGQELLAECKTLNGCNTGEAKITKAYKLSAQHVIHTVGPIWTDNPERYKEYDQLLAACYKNSLLLAVKHNITTIAFPNISTGVYHFPLLRAAKIAISEVSQFTAQHTQIQEVIFAVFSDENEKIYKDLLNL